MGLLSVGKVRAPFPGRKGTCSVCISPDRHKIDIGLVHKVPMRILATRFGVRSHTRQAERCEACRMLGLHLAGPAQDRHRSGA